MKIITTVSETHSEMNKVKELGKKIVIVPTMGYLHDGHLSLLNHAKELGDVVISTLFVNPKQFGPNEDYDKYPRDFERDRNLLEKTGCDYLFYPEVSEMYGEHFSTQISLGGITKILEGVTRPTHYDGVALIVLKLFNITKCDVGIFGQKDYQQFMVIQKMVNDLNLDIQLVMAPIIRENNGLAMSSRNRFLSQEEFTQAAILNKSLIAAKEKILGGMRKRNEINKFITKSLLTSSLIKIDYVETVIDFTFVLMDEFHSGDRIVILLACWFGTTRLIDNIIIQL
ncbi:MAG: pantoate--beta-alanine ligase [Ignavibacteria bacterium GWF2_33_9]|nr:MAG: pantoate--beta-alanine ligase [Ignavibacteria bacterium GWF2_33_9]